MNNPSISVHAKVLLVDDEHQQLEVRASILRMAGYSVLTAEGPIEALALGSTIGEFDIAVVDYDMPTMNGGMLAEHLKASFPKLNIILYSAAMGIPSRHLSCVDAFVPKGQGVSVLLHYLSKASSQIGGFRQRADPSIAYENPESPPGNLHSELDPLPAVFAATNAA